MAKETRPVGDHPVSRAVARLDAELADLAGVPLLSMGAEETGTTLVALGRLAARVAELELRLAAHAEEVQAASASGASSTANWWAHATNQDRRTAAGRVRLAEALGRFHAVREALAGGAMNVEQARVITRALDGLPDDLDPDLLAKAEAHLVAEAAHHDPKALSILGKHLLTVIAPDLGEAADARAFEREEREARARACFTMCPDGRGSMVGKFRIPEAQGQMLHKALMAFAAPKHRAATDGAGTYERRPSPERLGEAFVELIERLTATDKPDLGGMGATVVAHIGLDSLLRDGDQPGWLDTGAVVSAAQVRRWACEAGIIPVVLGGRSEVLDLGRSQRLFSKAQRAALRGPSSARRTSPTAATSAPPPRPHPRPRLRDDPASRRQGLLPPTRVGRRGVPTVDPPSTRPESPRSGTPQRTGQGHSGPHGHISADG